MCPRTGIASIAGCWAPTTAVTNNAAHAAAIVRDPERVALLGIVHLPFEFARRFGIHALRPAERDVGREAVLLAEFLQERILSRQVVRDDAVRAIDLFNGRAGVRRNLLVRRPPVLAAANHRL